MVASLLAFDDRQLWADPEHPGKGWGFFFWQLSRTPAWKSASHPLEISQVKLKDQASTRVDSWCQDSAEGAKRGL
jgi:hypothetical protein